MKAQIDLNKVKIATPCTMSWNEMKGDDRVRHCGACKLNVFNVENLSKEEAKALIQRHQTGERVCVRLARRADGTLITKDCPVGVRKWWRTRLQISAAVSGVFAMALAFFAQRPQAQETTATPPAAEETSTQWMGSPIMGDVQVDEAEMGEMEAKPQEIQRPKEPQAMRTMGKISVED